MKKSISVIIAAVLICTCVILFSDFSNTDGSYKYTINEGNATITNFDTSISGEIIIPDALDDCPVTSIGSNAFADCKSITKITIPDTVISIGRSAFNSCIELTEIKIPDTVISIGDFAFEQCLSLTKITIPKSVTSIGEGAFYNCSALTDVYYEGTKEQWDNIEIDMYNEALTKTNIHFFNINR